MTIIKTNPQKLLLAFAKIVNRDKQIAKIAYTLSILEPYSLFNSTKLISKKEIYEIFREFQELSKYKEIPTKKLFKKFTTLLFKKGIIEISKNSRNLKSYEIAIIPINNKYLLITNNLKIRFKDFFV